MRPVLISGCVVILVAIACTQAQDKFVGPYANIWADDQCSFLGGGGGNPGPSLSSCQSSCLDDSPCTAIAYDGSTCYWLECPVPVPAPGKHDPGWQGYSLASATARKPLLGLYETTSVKQIWTDTWSGANDDVAIWRVDTSKVRCRHMCTCDYRSLGDIATNSYNPPERAFVVDLNDLNDKDTLRLPLLYAEIWNDRGSGALYDVKIWKAICPEGFVALGYIATDGSQPERDALYCVNRKYVLQGKNDRTNLKKVWADHGSGADADVSIYEAVSATNHQQAVQGFGAVGSHSGYSGAPYFLNKNFVEYKGILRGDGVCPWIK